MASLVKSSDGSPLSLAFGGGSPYLVLSCVPSVEYDAEGHAVLGSQRTDAEGVPLWTLAVASAVGVGRGFRDGDRLSVSIHSATDPCAGGTGLFTDIEGLSVEVWSRRGEGGMRLSLHGTGLVGLVPFSAMAGGQASAGKGGKADK